MIEEQDIMIAEAPRKETETQQIEQEVRFFHHKQQELEKISTEENQNQAKIEYVNFGGRVMTKEEKQKNLELLKETGRRIVERWNQTKKFCIELYKKAEQQQREKEKEITISEEPLTVSA